MSYLRRKHKLKTMFPIAQIATDLRLVSSFYKHSLRNMKLVDTTKAATCTIIHSDRLYTDFFASNNIVIVNIAVHAAARYTKVLYSSTMGLKKALKLKLDDLNLISILVALSIGWFYLMFITI